MSRESMGGYIPPEETKRKKRETEMELTEIVVESASFSTLGAGIGFEKAGTFAEVLNTGADSALSGNTEIAKKTGECGRIYEAALDEVDGLARKNKEDGRTRKTKPAKKV